jgi:tetratricopeptide (TPR) repeat protein
MMGSFIQSKEAVPFFETAEACMQRRDFNGAISGYTRIIEIEVSNQAAVYAYQARAAAYVNLGNLGQAAADWTQALAIEPYGEMAVEIYKLRAKYFAQTRNIDAAINDISKAIGMMPNYANAYNQRAQYRMDKQDFSNAVADLSRAIDLDQKNYVFYLNRGHAYQGMSDLQSALLDYSQAVSLEPRDADNYFYRGAIYENLGKLDLALKDMNEAVRLNANDSNHFRWRGYIRLSLNDFDGALSDFKQTVRLDPSTAPDLSSYMAKAHAGRSLSFGSGSSDPKYDIAEAFADAEIAIQLQPNSPLGYYARGKIRVQDDMRYLFPKQITESAQLAFEDFNKAIQIAPDHAGSYAERGGLNMKYGRYHEAFEDMKAYLRFVPDSLASLRVIQSIVNELADDGYTLVEHSIVISGKPGYNELIKRAVYDWDHYLAWRLKSKAAQTESAHQGRSVPTDYQQDTKPIATINHEGDPVQRPIDKVQCEKFKDLGLRHKREGNYTASKDAYFKAIQQDHTDVMAYYGLAKTCYLAKNRREAILNYLAAIHLSLGNMVEVLNGPNGGLMQFQLKVLAQSMEPGQIASIRSVHPHADLLLLDDATPRNLGHALVDLDPTLKKSHILNRCIDTYVAALKGDSSVQLNQEIESKHYLPIGHTFAYYNLRWSKLNIQNPYLIYSITDQFELRGLGPLVQSLPSD